MSEGVAGWEEAFRLGNWEEGGVRAGDCENSELVLLPLLLSLGTRISTVTATGWNWGSSSHTLTSSGQGRDCGTWHKVRPGPHW